MTGDQHRFVELVDRICAEAGRSASVRAVAETIVTQHPAVFRTQALPAFLDQVRKVMTRDEAASGGVHLPRMVSIDGAGTYVQRVLLDVDEYRVAIGRYARQSRESLRKAYAMARECQQVHDVWIDPAKEQAS